MIGYEPGVTETVDPVAGSYYVESLTEELERLATDYIGKIDAMGGAVRAIEAGLPGRDPRGRVPHPAGHRVGVVVAKSA